jgi:hypothetical protein
MRVKLAGLVVRMERKGNEYKVLLEKPEGKIPLQRPRLTWDDNIKMDRRDRMCFYGLV